MDLLEAIQGRRSVRKFKGDPVPNEHIVEIIRAASLAPSGRNQQTWHFLAVKNRAVLDEMRTAVHDALREMLTWPESATHGAQIRSSMVTSAHFAEAPVTIAVLTRPYHHPYDSEIYPARGLTWDEIYHLRGDPGLQGMGAAVQTMLLRAYSLGYGSCWMTGPLVARPALERALKIQDPWRLIALVPIGVPDGTPAAKPRKPVEEILTIVD